MSLDKNAQAQRKTGFPSRLKPKIAARYGLVPGLASRVRTSRQVLQNLLAFLFFTWTKLRKPVF